MKTNFKKVLAVFLAGLVLASSLAIAVSAAAYTVTYMPGEGVEGEVIVEEFDRTIKIKGETYYRDHYTHTGWSTTEGGSLTNAFNSTFRKRENLVLYPVWTGVTYTLTYSPGAYGEGAERSVSAEYGAQKGLLGAIFTREGYVQLGWSLTDGGELYYELSGTSDIIEGNVTLYPYWARMCDVVYSPGAYGTGAEVVESVQTGGTFTAKGAIFTRPGYTQIGWSTEDGGRKVYELSQNFIPVEGDMVLYPFWLQNICTYTVSSNELYFGDFCEDYVLEDIQSFDITNTGNTALTITLNEPDYYYLSTSGTFTLAVDDTVTIMALPKENLPTGDYAETLTIQVAEAADYDVALRFSVSDHVYGVYKSNNDASYTQDGTKTAECVKGCGSTDKIVEPGTMRVYSVDNNTAAGLAASYVHHRTVRFTAYGSGMDAETVEEVGKRYRPISWFVSDEFNGEFEDGYEVTFTHTVFGEYTLTINYVEESYDAATGEWVETGATDTKTFAYTVGATAEEEQEIIMPNTILSLIFGLFQELLKLLGLA